MAPHQTHQLPWKPISNFEHLGAMADMPQRYVCGYRTYCYYLKKYVLGDRVADSRGMIEEEDKKALFKLSARSILWPTTMPVLATIGVGRAISLYPWKSFSIRSRVVRMALLPVTFLFAFEYGARTTVNAFLADLEKINTPFGRDMTAVMDEFRPCGTFEEMILERGVDKPRDTWTKASVNALLAKMRANPPPTLEELMEKSSQGKRE